MLRRYDVENAELILEEQKEQQAALASRRLIELGTKVDLLYWYKSTNFGRAKGAAGGACVATPDRTRY
jgi:pantothenate kinase